MATTKRKRSTSPTKRSTRPVSRKSKNKNKTWLQWLLSVLVVFLVLGAIAMAAGYVYMRTTENNQAKTLLPSAEAAQQINESKPSTGSNNNLKLLEGTWVSTTTGAMLSLKGETFSLDFPSVEAEKPMSGNFALTENKFSVVNNGKSVCNSIKGTYSITFAAGDLVITLLHDECGKRKNTLQSTWYKL